MERRKVEITSQLFPVPQSCTEVISRWRTMDAIKKKMQAMKVEKDNAMDRADVCEQASKDAKV